MKSTIPFLLLAVSMAASTLGTGLHAADDSFLVSTRVISLASNEAEALMSSAELRNSPELMLRAAQKLVVEKKAEFITHQSVSIRPGEASNNESMRTCTFELRANAARRDGLLEFAIAIQELVPQSEQKYRKIVSQLVMRRGEIKLLGTFDPPSDLPAIAPRLVFISVR